MNCKAPLLVLLVSFVFGVAPWTGSPLSAAEQGDLLLTAQAASGELAGWKAFLEDPGVKVGDVWRLADGVLTCRGTPKGYLYTEREYGDFVLTLDWRWPPSKQPGKGGVLIRTTGPDKIWPKSLEAQLNAPDAGDFWGLDGYQLHGPADRLQTIEQSAFGRLTNLKKTAAAEKPAGQWNHYEIRAQGGTVTLTINGRVVNQATGCEPSSGKICLTSEGDEIQIRNVRLSPIGVQTLTLHTRSRPENPPGSSQFPQVYQTLQWDPAKTAVVICDMWDKHWCKAATARVAEMAPRMNRLIGVARDKGALIIHCPSDTLSAYKDSPGRMLAQAAPKVEPKVPLQGWCVLDARREGPQLPIDDSDGGCPCEPKCKPGRAWSRQIDTLEIKPGDAITDSAEAYYLMRQRGIENVIVMGVHTNMCVLGRPFGIRQLVGQGLNVVLVRDMTDTMYNPRMRPQVDHFRGTELVVEHIEKHWCPTITSSDFLGGAAFRFQDDPRPQVVFLISEDEYSAAKTLPEFAQSLRDRFSYDCTVVLGHSPQDLNGIEALKTADLAVLFVRRRALPKEQVDMLRAYLDAGKPLVALRTASHAFAVNGSAPAGSEQWPSFDADVLGCHYHGHGPNSAGTDVALVAGADHPILKGLEPAAWHSLGSIYNVEPVAENATILAVGSTSDVREPVAWTWQCKASRVFYTSLGHRDDFTKPQFRTMLTNAVHWALNRPIPDSPAD